MDGNSLTFYCKSSKGKTQCITEFSPFQENTFNFLTPTYENFLPRCPNCNAYANSYNSYFDNKMKCCICDSVTTIKNIKKYNLEYKQPFYYSPLQYDKALQEKFKLTEYFILSKSIFENKAIINTILNATFQASTFKYYGIAVYHGSLSFLQFYPSFSLQTIPFSSEIPDLNSDRIFCGSLVFKDFVMKALERIKTIERTCFTDSSFILDFCKKISEINHTNFHLVLDENDMNNLSQEKEGKSNDFQSLADFFLLYCSRINFFISFSKFYSFSRKVFLLSRNTNGYIIVCNENNQNVSLQNLREKLNQPSVYDGRIQVFSNGYVKAFYGPGLTSGKGIHLCGIVDLKEKFYIDIELEKRHLNFLQFVFYFSTVLGVHRALVITVDLEKEQMKESVLQNFISLQNTTNFDFLCSCSDKEKEKENGQIESIL